MAADRAEATRAAWLEVLQHHKYDADRPAAENCWSPRLDQASRDELVAIQNAKLQALTPFLYENSAFYRRFDRLGLAPTDIRRIDDLGKWPVVEKAEMAADAASTPPYGTFTTMTEAVWAARGWMMFASSGTTGPARVFRYSQIDRQYWAWANARALLAMGFRHGDTVFMLTGYGPHVFAWGVQVALAKMGLPAIPGGGMDARARAGILGRFRPSILLSTPSYMLHFGRVLQELGQDPRQSGVKLLLVGGEPAMGIDRTRERIQDLWGARLVEFYGCTEASPHVGGYSCPASQGADGSVHTHLMEDVQVWETIDPDTGKALPAGQRGLTVCTNLNSESSPQLRFLVGDFATFDPRPCACGRTHVRAVGCFIGRSDDVINLRGIKLVPSQLEEAVRSLAGVGDEFEIVLATDGAGMEVMRLRIEHPAHADAVGIEAQLIETVRSRCEVRVGVEVLPPGTLPKTEFKAKRVKDRRVPQ